MSDIDEQTELLVDNLRYYLGRDDYNFGDRDKAIHHITVFVANQVREARIKEAEYYLRNAAELSLKRTVGVNVIKDRIAALKGDDK